MEGVGFVSGVLFPFVNFALFLTVLICIVRKPLRGFVAKRRQDFLQEAQDASDKAEELHKLQVKIKKESESIAQEITTIIAQVQRAVTARSEKVAQETRMLVTQIEQDTKQITQAYRQEIHAHLRLHLLHAVEQQLQGELPKHDAVSRAQASSKLRKIEL